MKRIAALAVVLSSAALGLVGGPARAVEDSNACTDGSPGEVSRVLLTSPIYLAVAAWPPANPGGVGICYRTSPTSPGTAGGFVTVQAEQRPGGVGGRVACASDYGVRQPVNCSVPYSATTTPTYSASGGTVTLNVPFAVCAGVGSCVGSSPNVAKSGVVVGTLSPVPGPTGSTGAAYRVSTVEVWLDGMLLFSRAGVQVGGAYVNYSVPGISTPTVGGSTPPCVPGGVCTPTISGMLGITGATESVTIILPTGGSTTVPVTVPATCLVNFSGPC